MALRSLKPDGTEGTATLEVTYKNGKEIIKRYGCMVKNDANLEFLIQKHINEKADKTKFKDPKCYAYMYDPDFKEERNEATVRVSCHRFSMPSQPKECTLDSSPHNFVKVQGHIFCPCDSEYFNNSKYFLKEHSKEILVAQDLTQVIFGLMYDKENKFPKFIPLKLDHPLSSNVYSIREEDYEKLEDAGPVLLKNNKTVVGSLKKRGNNEISISIFGNNQEITTTSSTDGAPGDGTGQAAATLPSAPVDEDEDEDDVAELHKILEEFYRQKKRLDEERRQRELKEQKLYLKKKRWDEEHLREIVCEVQELDKILEGRLNLNQGLEGEFCDEESRRETERFEKAPHPRYPYAAPHPRYPYAEIDRERERLAEAPYPWYTLLEIDRERERLAEEFAREKKRLDEERSKRQRIEEVNYLLREFIKKRPEDFRLACRLIDAYGFTFVSVVWLANLLDAPPLIKAICKSNAVNSPMLDLMQFPKVSTLPVNALVRNLREIYENDVANLIEKEIPENERNCQLNVSLYRYERLFKKVATMLDKERRNNWRTLGSKFGLQDDELEQIVSNPARILLEDYVYQTMDAGDLMYGWFQQLVNVVNKPSLPLLLRDSGYDRRSIKDVFPPGSEEMWELCLELNKSKAVGGMKKWEHLAACWGIKPEIYSQFDPSQKTSPTEILLRWLVVKRPDFTVNELCDHLGEIGCHDAKVFLEGKLNEGPLQKEVYV